MTIGHIRMVVKVFSPPTERPRLDPGPWKSWQGNKPRERRVGGGREGGRRGRGGARGGVSSLRSPLSRECEEPLGFGLVRPGEGVVGGQRGGYGGGHSHRG